MLFKRKHVKVVLYSPEPLTARWFGVHTGPVGLLNVACDFPTVGVETNHRMDLVALAERVCHSNAHGMCPMTSSLVVRDHITGRERGLTTLIHFQFALNDQFRVPVQHEALLRESLLPNRPLH